MGNPTGNFLPSPEVQEALSDDFDGIECSVGPGPDLSQSPFRLEVAHLGRQITFVPDVAHLDEFDSTGLHRINLSKSSKGVAIHFTVCQHPNKKPVNQDTNRPARVGAAVHCCDQRKEGEHELKRSRNE
ncbi:hypothetical protein ANCDUO_06615 [Ancylostoma duodenale]|uniref:Uncharacterized protein n=1 Tax=Ancylostoma duodenale TaxID=51022 RepID=A0A0C2H128_9BILA|nr:hypothetical protein ANCDUO_06615 [Ancylostoma duodenale]